MRRTWHTGLFQKFVDVWPGKRKLGVYRYLPIFFCMGAALEFVMIKWKVSEVNFCKF